MLFINVKCIAFLFLASIGDGRRCEPVAENSNQQPERSLISRMQCSTGNSSFTWWVWQYSVTIFKILNAAEVGHMILESTQYTKILKSLAKYSLEVVHNLVGVLGHLSANGWQNCYCFWLLSWLFSFQSWKVVVTWSITSNSGIHCNKNE